MVARAESAGAVVDLAGLGRVPETYRHEQRVAAPGQPLVLPNAVVKWSQVHRAGQPVPEALDSEARTVVAEAFAAGDWDPSYGMTFAILHRSTTHAYLLVGVWRNHQELWQRMYWRDLAGGGFERTDTSGPDAPVGCVWELAVTCHERMAWHRFLFSDRSEAAKRVWLADVYTGPA